MTQAYNKNNKILIYNADCNIMLDKMKEAGMTVACMQSNRRFIGAEIDEKYFNVTKDRLDGRFEE